MRTRRRGHLEASNCVGEQQPSYALSVLIDLISFHGSPFFVKYIQLELHRNSSEKYSLISKSNGTYYTPGVSYGGLQQF